MKRKRLDRRGWVGLKSNRYKQAVIDDCILGLLNFDEVTTSTHWGNLKVIDVGMKWLHILPLNENYVITAMISEDNKIAHWYIDIIGSYGYSPDGVVYFDDLYLDFTACPDGRFFIHDMDELDEALQQNEIDMTLYTAALKAKESLETCLLNDIDKFNTWCMKLLCKIELLPNCKGEFPMLKNYTYTSEPREPKTYRYLLSTPENYDSKTECLPLIVFLHGAGERGTDVNEIKIHGIPKIFDKGNKTRVITVSPQCDLNTTWSAQVNELKAFIDYIVNEYNIDKKRISITGLSMGGFGTWAMGIAFPDYFSALAPVCGGNGMVWLAPLLKDIPIRAFHGTEDTVVLPSASIEMVEAVNKAGGKAKLTLYEGVEHDSWIQAYEQSDLIEWLINQVKA